MFGIGEDDRMAARALQVVDVPCCVVHPPAANGASCSERTFEPLIGDDPRGGPYAFNIICVAAPIQATWILQAWLEPVLERYKITSWPWETLQVPDAWMPLLDVADGIWPSSRFTSSALVISGTRSNDYVVLPCQTQAMIGILKCQTR